MSVLHLNKKLWGDFSLNFFWVGWNLVTLLPFVEKPHGLDELLRTAIDPINEISKVQAGLFITFLMFRRRLTF